jgi:hypothetical protein
MKERFFIMEDEKMDIEQYLHEYGFVDEAGHYVNFNGDFYLDEALENWVKANNIKQYKFDYCDIFEMEWLTLYCFSLAYIDENNELDLYTWYVKGI